MTRASLRFRDRTTLAAEAQHRSAAPFDRRWPGRAARRPPAGGPFPARVRLGLWLARLNGWPRRLLAVALLAAAAVLAIRGTPAPPPPHPGGPGPAAVPVLAAARDLPAGAAFTPASVRTVLLPAGVVPAGALRPGARLAGRTAAGPMRRGELVTDARLLGPGLTAGLSDAESAAVPVRITEGLVVTLVQPGDRVDLLAAVAQGATPAELSGSVPGGVAGAEVARVVADGVRVLAVLPPPAQAPEDGALLVVAVSDAQARGLAGAGQARMSVAVRKP